MSANAHAPDDRAVPHLRLLGAAAMLVPCALSWRNERRFRLAAYLALSGELVGRDQLAALFWPERSQPDARSNLRKLVMELRELGLPGLQIDRGGLCWPVTSDVGALRAAHARGDAAAVAAVDMRTLLQDLDGGDGEAFNAWLQSQRESLRSLWREGVLKAIEASTPAVALAFAQRLLEGDPLDDVALRTALTACRALDRQTDASRLYESYRTRLAHELGVEPASALQALARSAPGTTGPAIGSQPDADFIGRADELQELFALLNDRRCRLLTVTGPGGVGKSALALQVLREHARAGADAAHWIALEDLDNPAQVLPRMARELGLRTAAHSDGLAEVAAHLAAQHELLVLDNAEHLDGVAGVVQRLLGAAPNLRCLATARAPLGVAGEWLMPIGALPLPDAQAGPDAVLRNDAVRLFVRDALAQQPRFDPAADPLALGRVVRLLGGLPLAIRLAAPWLRHFSLATLTQEVQRSLDILEQTGSPDEHPAHASVRATFERSWLSLSVPLQQLLSALSVCVSPIAVDAALRVAGARMPQLAALADPSLIVLDSDGRCALHPLIHQFAAEKLAFDPARERELRDRHADVFASRIAPWKHFSEVDPATALRAIALDVPNLLRAWDHAILHGRFAVLDDCAPGLSNHFQAQGSVASCIDRFARAQQAIEAAPQPQMGPLWRVALEHAALNYWLANNTAMEQAARQALRAARAVRAHGAIRIALNTLGLAALRLGRPDDGARLLMQALESARADGSRFEVAAFAGNLSGVLRELGDFDRAASLAQEGLDGHRANGNAVGEVSTLNELGLLAHQAGRLDAAIGHYKQALAIAERQQFVVRRTTLLTHIASALLDQGQLEAAERVAEQALQQVLAVGAPSHEPTCRRVGAEIALRLGKADLAREQLRAAAALIPRDDVSVAARSLAGSCAAYALAHGDPAGALRLALVGAGRAPPLPRYQALRDAAAAALGVQGAGAAEQQAGAMTLADARREIDALLSS